MRPKAEEIYEMIENRSASRTLGISMIKIHGIRKAQETLEKIQDLIIDSKGNFNEIQDKLITLSNDLDNDLFDAADQHG